MDVMILAAGFGSRLAPLTKRLPKPLVACAGRRLIDWSFDLVDQAQQTGCHQRSSPRRRVAASHHHRHGDRLLSDGFEEECRNRWRYQGCIVVFETLLVANADILIELDMRDMKAEHIYTQAAATVAGILR